MNGHFSKALSVLLSIAMIICLAAMGTEAMADQGWSTGDCFTFTAEEFGDRLDSILRSRGFEAYTVLEKDTGIAKIGIFEAENGVVPDDARVACSITFSTDYGSENVNRLDTRNISGIFAFFFDTEEHPDRITQICKAMIQTVDPSVADDQAKYIINKAKDTGNPDAPLFSNNGVTYYISAETEDMPAGFVMYADGIRTDFSVMPQITRKAVNSEGFCVTFGELLETLEELLTDEGSAFYAGSNCWFEDTSADASSGKFESIHCGATSFLVSGYSKVPDHIVESNERFDMVTVGIILENGESNIKDLTSVLSAILYLTNDELTDAQSAEQFFFRVLGDGPDKWTQTGALEYQLSSVIGTIMIFSVREINAYKNT